MINIIGHDNHKKAFAESFEAHKLHHAWLFSGNEGIGKCSLATSIAHFLLHTQAQNSDSIINTISNFDETSTYKQMMSGSHPDYKFISCEPNEHKKTRSISVDEIRSLTTFSRLTPSISKYKVIAIDGADHMNRNASNCLLKLLEEPQKNVILMLVTNSLSSILPTIRSRCISLRMQKLSLNEFNQVLSGENEYLYNLTDGNIKLAKAILKNPKLIDAVTKMITDPLMNYENLNMEDWEIIKFLIFKLKLDEVKKEENYNTQQLQNLLNNYISSETFNLDKKASLLEALIP